MQKRALTLRQAMARMSAGAAVPTTTTRRAAGRKDLDHIADALTKIYENRHKLSPAGDS